MTGGYDTNTQRVCDQMLNRLATKATCGQLHKLWSETTGLSDHTAV